MRNVGRAALAALARGPWLAGGRRRSPHSRRRPRRAAEEGAELPSRSPRRGFNVVLLLGDMQGPASQDSRFPTAARRHWRT